jgi:hypothetical protein
MRRRWGNVRARWTKVAGQNAHAVKKREVNR